MTPTGPSPDAPLGGPQRPVLTWVHTFPLASNPFVLWDTGKSLALTAIALDAMLGAGLAIAGRLGDAWPLLLVMWGVAALAGAVWLIVAAGPFRNRYTARFVLEERGASLAPAEENERGTAIFSSAGATNAVAWEDVHKIVPHPRRYVITLKNRWRPMLRLYCDEDTYPQALEFARAHVGA